MYRAARAIVALTGAAVLLASIAGAALAVSGSGTLTSKSINTTTGECTKDANGNPVLLSDMISPCGAAVYGESGFSGRIWGSGSVNLADYICVHTPGENSFKSYGATLTFTVLDGASAEVGSASETITGGIDCSSNNSGGVISTTGVVVDFEANGGVVSYTVSISGVTPENAQSTFSAYNSMRNDIFGRDTSSGSEISVTRSASVAPPGPPVLLPEAPAAVMLLVSAGLTVLAFVGWRAVRRPRTALAAR